MPIDSRWRAKIEALQLAGWEYVLKDRVTQLRNGFAAEPTAPVSAVPASPTLPTKPAAVAAQKAASAVDALKLAELEVLRGEVAQCTKCSILCHSRTQTVFNDGDPQAELCFVGEAPGADEDATGVPFVGRAGQLLTKIIEACKLRRDQVYICNVLKCRPPENRNPMPDEVENCRPYLERQLKLVQPKLMVALGKYATAYLLNKPPESVPITKLRGQIHHYCGIPFMITLHPAYLLRNPAAKKDVWEDMKTVMRMLGKPVE